jgi:hypothetical protein
MNVARGIGHEAARSSFAWPWHLVLLALGLCAYALPLYLYAAHADNHFVNTAIDYSPFFDGSTVRFLLHEPYYPPFYYLWLGLGTGLLRLSYAGAVLLSIPLAAAAAFYLSRLAREAGGDAAGWAAPVVFFLLPGAAMALSSTVRDVPLALFACGAVYHGWRSQGGRRLGHAAAFGLHCGLGMLTKWTFPIYLLGWLPLLIRPALRPARAGAGSGTSRSPWPGVALAAAVALALCGWWYVGVLDWTRLWITTRNDPSLPQYDFLGMARLIAASLFDDQLRAFWWPLVALGAVAGSWKPRARGWTASAAAAVISTVLVLSLVVHAEHRYLFPALPWIAFLIAQAVPLVRSAPRQAVVVALLAAVGVAGYADTVLGWKVWMRGEPMARMSDHCDAYQYRGRLPWNDGRGTRQLARAIEDVARPFADREMLDVFAIGLKEPMCVFFNHSLLIGTRDPWRRPTLHFLAYESSDWPGRVAASVARGGPSLFVVEEDVGAVPNVRAVGAFVLDPRSGRPLTPATLAERALARQAIRARLPRIAEVILPSVGRVGIYLHAAGGPDPLADLRPAP